MIVAAAAAVAVAVVAVVVTSETETKSDTERRRGGVHGCCRLAVVAMGMSMDMTEGVVMESRLRMPRRGG
jgi:hypothetical protein